jgi:hypothetical protein
MHVYTASQAIAALQNNPPFELVCLDHDLGDFENKLLTTALPNDCP